MIKYYNMTWTKEMKINVSLTGAIADSLNVYLKLLRTLFLGQKSNFPWGEPSFNLSRPKLSYGRLLDRTSNLGRVESVRSATNFLQNEAKQVFNFLVVY